MTEPKRCCDNPIKFVIVYNSGKIIVICQKHSTQFEYQRGIKKIFDYKTKNQLTIQEAFS